MVDIRNRRPVEFDEYFKEDIEQYYNLFQAYLNLKPENYSGAYNIAQYALALADRWNDICVDAGKIATMRHCSKTDLYKYCYAKYRQMQLIYEHARSTWKTGEDANRYTAR